METDVSSLQEMGKKSRVTIHTFPSTEVTNKMLAEEEPMAKCFSAYTTFLFQSLYIRMRAGEGSSSGCGSFFGFSSTPSLPDWAGRYQMKSNTD